MKTTIATEQTPQTKQEQLRGEVNRLIDEVATAETNLATANARSVQLTRDIEEAEDSLIHGRINAAALKALRDRHAAVGAEVVQLSSDIRVSRRLLEKAQSALTSENDRADRERHQQTRRRMCELIAPLLDAACVAIDGLLELPGISSELASWSVSFEGQSESARLASIMLSTTFRSIIGGDGSALTIHLHALKSAAPDLFTDSMQAFLNKPVARHREREEVQDSKAASRANMQWLNSLRLQFVGPEGEELEPVPVCQVF